MERVSKLKQRDLRHFVLTDSIRFKQENALAIIIETYDY